jgi:hypothetical protein
MKINRYLLIAAAAMHCFLTTREVKSQSTSFMNIASGTCFYMLEGIKNGAYTAWMKDPQNTTEDSPGTRALFEDRFLAYAKELGVYPENCSDARMANCLEEHARSGADGAYSFTKCLNEEFKEVGLNRFGAATQEDIIRSSRSIDAGCEFEVWVKDRQSWSVVQRACK